MTDRAIRNQVEHPRKRDRGCSRPISAYTHARSNPQDRSAFISRSSLILDWHGIIIPNSRNGMIVRAPHSYRLFDLTFIRLVEDLELHIPRRRFRWKVIPTANSWPIDGSLIADIVGSIPPGVPRVAICSEVASLYNPAGALERDTPLPAHTSILHEICTAWRPELPAIAIPAWGVIVVPEPKLERLTTACCRASR